MIDKLAFRLNRRAFVASGLAAGVLGGLRPVFAQSGDTLKVGFISPRAGPLAGFGKTDGYVLDVARAALANGLSVGGKTFAVEILDRDTQSDPSRAGQLARDLINGDGVDLMLAVSTPETINPVSDACEAAGIPCLSTVMPWKPGISAAEPSRASLRRSSGPIISASASTSSTGPTSRSGG